jgi:hypothetical protein
MIMAAEALNITCTPPIVKMQYQKLLALTIILCHLAMCDMTCDILFNRVFGISFCEVMYSISSTCEVTCYIPTRPLNQHVTRNYSS